MQKSALTVGIRKSTMMKLGIILRTILLLFHDLCKIAPRNGTFNEHLQYSLLSNTIFPIFCLSVRVITYHTDKACIMCKKRKQNQGCNNIFLFSDVIMSTMASQITSLAIVYSNVYSGEDQRKYQNSASLAFVRRIHRWPVNSPHKGPVTRKMFPFDESSCTNLYVLPVLV